ncbi:hypothetical protein OG563_26295 [Nocardia vinacea]|uniref:DUF4145 domain-containing protein n=1 Tax=Nocardia vinacea TaxID=96468 RepID=A0ABZ1YLF3_9NOCA|nr:hypothetical protein [Nocardia vinacea]
MKLREEFRDRQDAFALKLQQASSDDERQRLTEESRKDRHAFQDAEKAAGRRQADVNPMIKQEMWLTWIGVAVRHAVEAQTAKELGPAALSQEFPASLIAVTASAYTVEAVYRELQFLLDPAQLAKDRDKHQYQTVRNAIAAAFVLTSAERQRLGDSLRRLFGWRNMAVHPYATLEPVVEYTPGLMSSVEVAAFNAHTSRTAVDCALEVLAITAAPQQTANPWVARWVATYTSSHTNVIDPLRALL